VPAARVIYIEPDLHRDHNDIEDAPSPDADVH